VGAGGVLVGEENVHADPHSTEPNTDATGEAAWVARAAAGDDAAWEDLVRAHQEAVFRLAYLLLGDADEAADLAQEVFLRTVRALTQPGGARFDPARPLRPWLLQITRNLAANRRRSLRRAWAVLRRAFQPPAAQLLPDLPHDRTHDPAQAVATADALWRAVRRLPPADQEVIYLRLFLELSVEEAAAALGVAPGTVKSRLNRALERLRAAAADEFPEWAEHQSKDRAAGSMAAGTHP
jgi:RNA polymerase sigma-70 factor (ECF subfamily)